MPVALRTSRLLLREWRDSDLEPFAVFSADPEVKASYAYPFATRAESDAWIGRMQAHFDEHGFAYWAVELVGEAALIGAIGMTRVHAPMPFAPAVEIGWRLARPYWGQGYALEGARAVLEDGFFRLGLAEIVSFTTPMNWRSSRVMERLGMSRDTAEDFDHPRVPDGHPLKRHVLYRLRRRPLG